MADETTAKTETVGYIDKDKLKGIKGWTEYVAAAEAFDKAKKAATKTKAVIKDALKSKLKQDGDIDFTDDGERIRVFKNLQKKPGRKGTDLSDLFNSSGT
jgi:autotransporter adhesin